MAKASVFRSIGNYLKFKQQAVNLHGLHSPFVYNLATKCLYDKTFYDDYRLLKSYHRNLKNNTQILEITDLGAGSRIFKTNKRRVKDMAQIAGSSYAGMKLLYRLAKYFKPGTILELGTSLGKGTYALALGQPEAKIVTVEGDLALANLAKIQLTQTGLTNIEVINDDFDRFLIDLNQTNQTLDLVYLDGNHRFEPTLRYFNLLQKHLHNNSVVVVDDIYWSPEMMRAWEALKQHNHVKQSIDVFYFGLLFFRKEQYEQNFKIDLHTLNLF